MKQVGGGSTSSFYCMLYKAIDSQPAGGPFVTKFGDNNPDNWDREDANTSSLQNKNKTEEKGLHCNNGCCWCGHDLYNGGPFHGCVCCWGYDFVSSAMGGWVVERRRILREDSSRG